MRRVYSKITFIIIPIFLVVTSFFLFYHIPHTDADHTCTIQAPSQVEFGKPYNISILPQSSNIGRGTNQLPTFPLTIKGKNVDFENEYTNQSNYEFSEQLGPGSYDLFVYVSEGSINQRGGVTTHEGCKASIQVLPSTSSDIVNPTPLPARSTNPADFGYEILPPPEEINGYTPEVSVSFFGLSSSEYEVCFESDIEKCERSQKKKTKSTTNNILDLPALCGDGPDAVKEPSGENCDTKKDYFHEGSIYRVSLFDKDTSSPIQVAEFYVRRNYPTVNIFTGTQLSVSKGKLFINGQEQKNASENIPAQNPLIIGLSQKIKVGGNKVNNFQIVLEGIGNNYKNEFCGDLTGDQVTGSLMTHFNNNSTIISRNEPNGQPLLAGNYLLKINEQINDTSFWRTDNCQGGFTYYHIPILVVLEHGENSQGVLNAYIKTNEIEADPNQSELIYALDEDKNSPLPCNQWVDINDKGTDDPTQFYRCASFATAIGPFGTKPIEFIATLGKWLLGVATVAAFIFAIYSGYILMTSRGDKEKIGHAREILISAVTGLIFLILSISILEIIGVDILALPGFSR